VIGALTATALMACVEGVAITPEPVVISVDIPGVTLASGDTVTARATVLNATDSRVLWRSSLPHVVAVDAGPGGAALLTALAPGSATVFAISVQDTTKQAQIPVVVQPPESTPELLLTPGELDLATGEVYRLRVSVTSGVEWRTSAPEVATVGTNGEVRAIAAGTATIIAALLSDPSTQAATVVRVGAAGPLTIRLDQTSYLGIPGTGTSFTATVSNYWNTAVIWRTGDAAIATVTPIATSTTGPREAVVNYVAAGRTTITAIAAADTTKRAYLDITVQEYPGVNTFTVDPGHADLDAGAVVQLTARRGAAAVDALWRSSDPSIAAVDASGLVTAHATGNAAVTALLASDTLRRATAFIRVGAAGPITLPHLGLGRVDERWTGEVAVRGDWAYTSTWGNRNAVPGNVIKVWDVAGAIPSLVDSLIVPNARTTGDVQISDDGDLLVVAVEPNPHGAILLYDRTNPARPAHLATYATANTRQGVHTVKLGRVNGRHFAFLSVNPGQQPARLVIADITDPRAPTEVWSGPMGRPFVHDVFVRDGLLFTALWHDGLRIFDIGGGGRGGAPSAPVVLGDIPTVSGSIHNIWWFPDPASGSQRYVFLGEEGPGSVPNSSSGDLHVIDVSDMRNPVQVAQYSVDGAGAHNFWMDEPSGILYAAFYNGGVRALDVRGDLGTCAASARNARGFCDLRQMGRERGVAVPFGVYIWGVVHQGTRVFASDMRSGLHVFDAAALRR
jgi:uncharacterized protein YjdB